MKNKIIVEGFLALESKMENHYNMNLCLIVLNPSCHVLPTDGTPLCIKIKISYFEKLEKLEKFIELECKLSENSR